MKQELVDLIILLNGNHVPFIIQKDSIETVDKSIEEFLLNEENDNKWMCIKDVYGWTRRIHPKAVVGWYFKPHIENLAEKNNEQVSKLLDILKNDTTDGDEWKN